MENKIETGRSICPYLGLRHDKSTSLAYESVQNYCFHCRKPVTPSIIQQKGFCLTLNHRICKVFLQNEIKDFPANLLGKTYESRRLSAPIKAILYGVLIVGLLGLGYYLFFQRGVKIPGLLPDRTAAPTLNETEPAPTELSAGVIPVTGNATIQPSDGPASIETITPATSPTPASPTFTATSRPTVTASQTLEPTRESLALDKSFKVDGREFILHRVLDGEGYDFLALKYKTTRKILFDLNYGLSYPLWIGSVIIIAPGMTEEDAALPSFRIHQVTEGEAGSRGLSAAGPFNPELLKHYNHCLRECSFSQGDWILIPYSN